MIQLTSRWHTRFLEDILVFVAELSILRFDHSVSSCLVYHRPNQRTPRYSFRITTNRIYKCMCRNHVNFDTISHLFRWNHHLVSTCYAITTLTNISTTRTSRSATNTISAWFTHTPSFLPKQGIATRESIQLIYGLYRLRKSIPKITSLYKPSNTYNTAYVVT